MENMRKGFVWFIGLAGILILAGCKGDGAPAVEGANEMAIQITSTAFNEGDKIPKLYSCDDKNVSPPLAWSGVPTDTVSLALIMDDPDAPSGDFVHWVLYNLPPDNTNLAQGTSGSGVDGKNDFGRPGYGGPCPPLGSSHRYYVRLYALDKMLELKPGASKAQLESAMRGHILAQGQLMGRYSR